MRFAYSAESALQELDETPILLKTAKFKMTLRHQNTTKLKVYSNTLIDRWRNLISASHGDDVIHF
jgi:hypothetical protein